MPPLTINELLWVSDWDVQLLRELNGLELSHANDQNASAPPLTFVNLPALCACVSVCEKRCCFSHTETCPCSHAELLTAAGVRCGLMKYYFGWKMISLLREMLYCWGHARPVTVGSTGRILLAVKVCRVIAFSSKSDGRHLINETG